MANCEQSFSSLLKKGDTTTIAVIIAIALASFLLGVVLTILCNVLRLRRKSSAPSSSALKSDTYRHSTSQKAANEEYDQAPFSPKSLSHTFVRNSFKPPMNMFSARERIEWSGLERHTYTNPFSSVGHESFSSVASEEAALSRRISLPRGAHVSNEPSRRSISQIEKGHRQGDLPAVRSDFGRSWSHSTLREDGSITDTSIFHEGLGDNRGSVSSSSRDLPRKQVLRAKSEPRFAHPGREKTQYDISAHERRPFRGPLPPQQPVEGSSDKTTTIIDNPPHGRKRRPTLTITDPASIVTPSDSPTLPDTTSTTDPPSGGVTFYKQHATRHLSMPYGGPLASAVLPESPSGVIGSSDQGPRQNFSLA